MPLFRTAIIALAIWAAFLIIRSFIKRSRLTRRSENRNKFNDKVVKCKQCGLHVPKAEAYAHGDDYFCSQQCEQEYRQR